MAILGELDRAGLLHTDVPTVHAHDHEGRAGRSGTSRAAQPRPCKTFYKAGPGGHPHPGGLQPEHALAEPGRRPRARAASAPCEHAFSQEGGLAVLYGNIALNGCVVKTAGVDDEPPGLRRPRPRGRESRTRPWTHILDDQVKAGDVVVVRYEGPQGRPRHAGDALPDQLPQVQGPGQGLRAADRRPLLRRHLRAVDRPRARRKRRRAAPSAWCATATASASTSPTARIDVLVRDEELATRRAEQDARAGSRRSRARARSRPR